MNLRQDIHNSEIPVLCQSCEVRHKGICGALDAEQLVLLAKTSSKHEISPGTPLINDTDSIDSYSNVLSGVVKLTKMLSDGRQQIVGLQFAPDFLGRPFKTESSLNADAATNVRLCSFPKTAVDRMMQESASLENRLLRQTLRELDEARDWILMLGRKTAPERVASFLLLVAKYIDPAADPDAPISFDLPLSRADIADYLGLTIETVSRQFTKLRAEGLIEIEKHRRITIEQPSRLEARTGS